MQTVLIAMQRAVAALTASVAISDWSNWIVYLLEMLDNEATEQAGNFNGVLNDVEDAIAIWRADGVW